jgi:hypothetical protein
MMLMAYNASGTKMHICSGNYSWKAISPAGVPNGKLISVNANDFATC